MPLLEGNPKTGKKWLRGTFKGDPPILGVTRICQGFSGTPGRIKSKKRNPVWKNK